MPGRKWIDGPIAATSSSLQPDEESTESEETMSTIVYGLDHSLAARAGLRVAASVANKLGACLVAVHVLDRYPERGPAYAERVAASVLTDEIPGAGAEPRGKVAKVAERLAAIAREEDALMIVLGAAAVVHAPNFKPRCAVELVKLTPAPVLIAPLQLAAARAAPELHAATTEGVLR
jgi:nucleotide-binding universal stress UspA family protein